jgi:hypothetical protein
MPKRHRRIWSLIVITVATLGLTAVATPARAAGAAGAGHQYCYYNGGYACLNAWGGGPWVNVWTGGPGQCNGDFTLLPPNAAGYYRLEFTCGSGGWNGHCIGDAYNDPDDARTSLDDCGFGGTGQGWGTNFRSGIDGCPAGYGWFQNVHWGGYLGPPDNWVNGSHFYLNKPGKICFKAYSPA